MANEVIPKKQYEIDPYEEYAEEVSSRAHITGNLLRYTKHGEYKAGADQDEVEEGTRMLVYMPSMKRGWVKWADQQPVQHVIGLVSERFRPPEREALGDMDESEWGELNGRPIDPWQKTNYLVMCDESGQLYTFVTSSKGGLSAVGELSSIYAKRRRMKPDEIPVIELHGRSYQHKDFGETFAPKFVITSWSKIPDTFEEVAASLGTEVTASEELPAPEGEVEIEAEAEVEIIEPVPEPEAPPPRAVKAKPVLVKPALKSTKPAAKAAAAQKPRRNGGKTLRF